MAKKKDEDLGASEVQEKVDQAEDKGHLGVAPDPTPNENYTVAGVTNHKPTPETETKK